MQPNSPDPHATPVSPRLRLIVASVIAAAAIAPTMAARAAAPAAGTPAPATNPVQVTSAPGVPRYFSYVSPPGTADDAGEPSLGINWTTEQVFANSGGAIPNGGTANYFGGFLSYMVKATFNDCQSPAQVTWEQKPLLTASTPRVFGDPILYTDRVTGRTFVTQEEGLTPLGSTTDFTDSDGNSFLPSQGSGAPSCVDHETVGGGPFHLPLAGINPVYPNAVYYASQCIADATIALSVDGGVTFGPSVPMFTANDCAGLHGHIKVAPDGTVYVPDKACGGNVPLLNGGEAAVVVSEDNGTTWTIRTVPGATSMGDDDPSVGVATDGTIYLGWQSADGHPRIAVSHDKGASWVNVRDVGAPLGIQNCTFPAVVAGDGGSTTGRAAFAFYGTTEAGAYDQPDFPGVWYLYIATTFDGGDTWIIQNVTPDDPVQRGGICSSGDCRNQLDFFDMSIDKEGRVLVGWDDGCVGGCVNGPPNSFTAKAVITRQSGGRRMYAAFDPVEPRVAEAPGVAARLDAPAVHLSWPAPDDGGAAITGYNIYRSSTAGGPYTLLATVSGTTYDDAVGPGNVYYHVTAVNSQGEGPYCQDVVPVAGPTATPCVLPGLTVVSDLNPDGTDNDSGQNIPPDPGVNVKSLSLAEPYVGAGVNQVTFTLQVAPSTGPVPVQSQWYIIWNRRTPAADGSDRRYVAMKTDIGGALSFEYGNFGPPLPLDGSIPPPNANTPTRLGAADSGSYDPATGVITIRLADANLDDTAPPVGSDLAGLNARTFYIRPDTGPRSQNISSDITGDGSYTLVGNAACFCFVNEPPVARLSATPTTGNAPLTVDFDGSASSDPNVADGDGVASYTFNFGDGSEPVTQGSPLISHQYRFSSGASGFFATLTVADRKCARPSLNVASVQIEVAGGTSAVGPAAQPTPFRLAPLTNPSYGQLFLSLDLDRDGPVTVQVFSAAGRLVADVYNSWMSAGTHALHWRGVDGSGNHIPAGFYIVRANAGGRVATTHVVVVH